MTQHLTPADYLKKILTARVYDVALSIRPGETALTRIPVGASATAIARVI